MESDTASGDVTEPEKASKSQEPQQGNEQEKEPQKTEQVTIPYLVPQPYVQDRDGGSVLAPNSTSPIVVATQRYSSRDRRDDFGETVRVLF